MAAGVLKHFEVVRKAETKYALLDMRGDKFKYPISLEYSMSEVSGHPRRHGSKTVYVEPQHRMPRKREHLYPEDREIYELEVEIVRLQRIRQSLTEDAEDYAEFGYPELSARKLKEAEVYDRRIEENQKRIQQIRHLHTLEGVEDED